jgi:hypothetical protein
MNKNAYGSEYKEISNSELLEMMKNGKEFRNDVAYAHGVALNDGTLLFKGTASYPQRYKVNDEIIEVAKKMIESAKAITMLENKDNLLWVGMGWHKADSVGDVGNCRIRTVLQNDKRENIFIELSAGRNYPVKNDQKNYIHGDFCFLEDGTREQKKYNHNGIESDTWNKKIEWSTANIIDFVNKELSCSFTKMYVDNFDIGMVENAPLCFSKKAAQ